MKFEPKSEEEVQSVGVLEGVFDFEIVTAREYVSDKGNETFELGLTVYDAEGKPLSKKAWVTPAFAKTFKHLHDACGMVDKYLAGTTIADDFIGKTGKVKFSKRKYINKDGLDVTGDKIEDFVKKDNLATYTAATKAADVLDDEIPF